MSNKETAPCLCVVFFPPYERSLGRRPPGVLMARVRAVSAEQVLLACIRDIPHQQLLSNDGKGSFFVGLDTDFDAARNPDEYENLIEWSHKRLGVYYLFIFNLVKSFLTTQSVT